MKRSSIGAGAKSLARGTTFTAPRRALPRRRKPTRPPGARTGMADWRARAQAGRCVICGTREWLHGHHIIREQHLRAHLTPNALELALYDTRNQLVVCEGDHAAHHIYARRIPRAVLERHAPHVFTFAAEHGLTWLLDREYPPPPREEPT